MKTIIYRNSLRNKSPMGRAANALPIFFIDVVASGRREAISSIR
jgi:hypothetical protein